MEKQQHDLLITPALAGERLDKALSALLPGLSRSRLQNLMALGHVTLDAPTGSAPVTDAAMKVRTGQMFTVTVPEVEPSRVLAQAIPLDIVYEDAHLLIINKQAGMTVHPAPGSRDSTLVNALLAHCGESLSGIGGVARPGIVHRIDKDTSGLLAVAKHDAAHRHLSEQLVKRTLKRTYLAICHGVPVPAKGTITGAIARHPKDRQRMAVVPPDHSGGKHAVTHYKVVEVYPPPNPLPGRERELHRARSSPSPSQGATYAKAPAAKQSSSPPEPWRRGEGRGEGTASLLECQLETGRTHQIRVHFAHIRHPLLGDAVYGKKGSGVRGQGLGRQALHAWKLGLIHPASGEAMEFEAELPEDMAGLLETLRKA